MIAKRFLRFAIASTTLAIAIMMVTLAKAYKRPAAIQFADPNGIEAKWPSPIQFEVLNNTTKDLRVNIQFSDFQTISGDGLLRPQDFLLDYVPDQAWSLASSGTLSVAMSVKSNRAEEPGSYAGSIIVSEPTSNIVIRKPLQMIIPDPNQREELVLTPAVSTLAIPAYRIWPLPIFWKQKLWCWRDCYLPVERTTGELISAEPIGYISGEKSNVLRVSVDDYSKEKGAKLRIEYLDNKGPVGKYSGTIDFLPQDEDAGEVALT